MTAAPARRLTGSVRVLVLGAPGGCGRYWVCDLAEPDRVSELPQRLSETGLYADIASEDVGMTPKRHAILRRFQRALDLATRSPTPAWSRIAAECGYYDQAHLCRDWVEISGLSPHAHVGRRDIPVNPNHVAVPEVGVNSVQYASRSRR